MPTGESTPTALQLMDLMHIKTTFPDRLFWRLQPPIKRASPRSSTTNLIELLSTTGIAIATGAISVRYPG